MIVVEWMVQQVRHGRWGDLPALDAKYNAVEKRLGFPPKRRLQCYFGGHNTDTLVVERQWESLAAMEAAYTRAFADPDWVALDAEFVGVIESSQIEVYAVLP